MEIKTGLEIFDEIKNLQDSMNDKYLSEFERLNNKKWVGVENLLERLESKSMKTSAIDIHNHINRICDELRESCLK